MVSKMVKIGVFETPVEAHIARNALEAEGIVATISNESLAGNAWHFGGAIGGVQLHVTAENVDAALRILSERGSTDASLDPQDVDEEFTREDFEKGWENKSESDTTVETEADRLAKRASRSGLFGLIFPALQLYTLWLLLLFCFEPTYATAKSRWLIAFAWLACVLGLICMAILLFPPRF